MIPPGSWLGLLGGGQLGRMFTMAAQSMGYKVLVLDPGAESPAGIVADRHIQADYLDSKALQELARHCKAATTEFENVPAAALEFLAQHCLVSPGAQSVSVAQDRIREKRFLSDIGIEVAPFAIIESPAGTGAAGNAALLPGILKLSRLGYDGKGQIRVRTQDQLAGAFRELGQKPCVLERMLDLALEVSVVVVRGFEGETATYPVSENEHVNGILDLSIVPARVSESIAHKARESAIRIAGQLDYRGVLCVEFFILRDGRLLANEIAPRPHNSGHYTIDACVTSQFEQQARVLAKLPLGDTSLHCPAVMVNILGDAWRRGEPDWRKVLAHPRAKLHLYGKAQARAGRKMGHITLLGEELSAVVETARDIKAGLAA
ncbi:MAG: 5-(carboxyamino)imidazole ribonucleotide synthase [Betaproteobacteria bacterium]|nr:5-(carboxyamino)imidazole ribonucleotide synthase [Betaproteobacteria bacterium]